MAIVTNLPILSEDVNVSSIERRKIKEAVDQLKSRFQTVVDKVASLTGLTDFIWLIFSIMYKENGQGNTGFVKSTGATGLMQVTPETASDAIIRESQKKRLTEPEKDFIRQKLGTNRANAIFKRKQLGLPVAITIADLKDPEFNVFMASIYLGQLIDECTIDSKLRLDYLITRYLRYYSKPKGSDANAVIAWVNSQDWKKSQKDENISYIKQVGGKNGIAHIIA